MYVGITRAQKELTISYCHERRVAGELQKKERSRFLDELGEENIIDITKQKNLKINDNKELKNRLEQIKNLLNK